MSETSTPWIATEATITSCKFQFARMNTFTLGVQTQDKYLITFDYYAHGQTYSDDFQSPVAIAQGEHVTIHYNPLNPVENDRSTDPRGNGTGRVPLFAIGVAGSVVLSLGWLLLLRSCH